MMPIVKFVAQNEQSPFYCACAAEATEVRLYEPEYIKITKVWI